MTEAASCRGLLAGFGQRPVSAATLRFSGVGDLDVYNPTAPFRLAGETYLAARVEHRCSELSQVRFFTSDGQDRWSVVPGAPALPLQDPFTVTIGDQRVIGGVMVRTEHPGHGRITGYETRFYRCSSLDRIEPFARGPAGMKDIRLVELAGGGIGVFTRPQGDPGGRGTIGFCRIGSLDDLAPDVIQRAHLLHGQFRPEEWGGVNAPHLLGNGTIGVLGHIACYDREHRKHYYPISFCFDPESLSAGPPRILATRDLLPPGPAKAGDLADVLFSGGLIRHAGGTASLYVGISDAGAGRLTIPDPFLDYE
ncbi:MAG: DUF1861 family protein [Streptosporangiaceae bacterium]